MDTDKFAIFFGRIASTEKDTLSPYKELNEQNIPRLSYSNAYLIAICQI